MKSENGQGPSYDRLYEVAASQEGHFTTQQAADAGYSPQLLFHHLTNGNVARVRRGIYRLVYFPAGENEDLVVGWLWSDREGVFSHQTALALHGLSDALPSKVHLTLPDAWKGRRLRARAGTSLHFSDIAEQERAWHNAVPVTTPLRTLLDCNEASLSPELLRQALDEARRRGIVEEAQVAEVERALAPFRAPAR